MWGFVIWYWLVGVGLQADPHLFNTWDACNRVQQREAALHDSSYVVDFCRPMATRDN